jgi:uncharacterized protein
MPDSGKDTAEKKVQTIAGVPPEIDVAFYKSMPLEASGYPGFAPGSRILKAGEVHREGGQPLPVDMIEERDQAVVLRDGTTIYVDIFRPVGDEPVSAILAWSPYGKRNGFLRMDIYPNRMDVDPSWEDGLNKFEGPNPGYWVGHGYAVVNSDSRGVGKSEGDIQFFGQQDAMDEYDLIEWLAEREWSDGKVALAGNSWLSVTQYFVAALRPPHLAAIAPWEGGGDLYRATCARGGIPEVEFSRLASSTLSGEGWTEDWPSMGLTHPEFDAYWQSKVPDLSAIEVPAYIVASWTNLLHTHATFEAWRNIASRDKWLRVHNTHEWNDFYNPANVEDLRRFFDHVVKGVDNGWEATPRVRLSVLDPGHTDIVGRAEQDFPLKREEVETYYLDLNACELRKSLPSEASSRTYDADSPGVTLRHTFDCDTEITGYGKLRLWIAADSADDLDVFVYVSKLDRAGVEQLARVVTDRNHAGMNGRLRASLRRLDPARSTPSEPFYSFTSTEKLVPGQPVALEIGLWPYSLFFHSGESLQLRVTGVDLLVRPEHPDLPKDPTVNVGSHTIHSGGAFDSALVLPVVGRV